MFTVSNSGKLFSYALLVILLCTLYNNYAMYKVHQTSPADNPIIKSLQALALEVVIHQTLRNKYVVEYNKHCFVFSPKEVTQANRRIYEEPVVWKIIDKVIAVNNIHYYQFLSIFNLISAHQNTNASNWFLHSVNALLDDMLQQHTNNQSVRSTGVYKEMNSIHQSKYPIMFQNLFINWIMNHFNSNFDIQKIFKRSMCAQSYSLDEIIKKLFALNALALKNHLYTVLKAFKRRFELSTPL